MDRSKWNEPGAIAAGIVALVTVGGLVWSAATISAASANLAGNFDDFKRAVTTQIQGVQNQIASLPTQGVRLDNVEHGLAEVHIQDASQQGDINTLKQGFAVLSSTVDTVRHDVQVLQDAANGRLPGGRR